MDPLIQPIPEPRIFRLKKYKLVNSFVSTKIYKFLPQLEEIARQNHTRDVAEARIRGIPEKDIEKMEPDWPLISADHCNSATPIQTYELELLSEEETLKSMQRLSLAKALRKMDMLTGKNKNIGRLISQHQEKLAHDRDVLKRKRRDDIVGGVLDDVIDGIFSVSDSGSSSDSVGYDTELVMKYWKVGVAYMNLIVHLIVMMK